MDVGEAEPSLVEGRAGCPGRGGEAGGITAADPGQGPRGSGA